VLYQEPKSDEMSSERQDAAFRKLDALDAEKFRNDLRLGVVSVGILTDDNLQFLFRIVSVGEILSVDGVRASVVPPAGRALKARERAHLVCLLNDGCYLVRVLVKGVSAENVSFVFENEIHRLERRDDCRTQVPTGFTMSFQIKSVNRTLVPAKSLAVKGVSGKFAVIDVSVRGFRMYWPESTTETQSEFGLPELKVGDHISGELSFPKGRRAEIFAVVRNLGLVNGQSQFGVELLNATIRDEQLLLFSVMQIRRQTAS
jgi:hypothetical protein